MLTAIHPKLPMVDKGVTLEFYSKHLGFTEFGRADYKCCLMMKKDRIQIHFFEFKDPDPKQNYGQVYLRTDSIDELYQTFMGKGTVIYPNGKLEVRLWGQKEFSLLDPDNNLLTFGQVITGT